MKNVLHAAAVLALLGLPASAGAQDASGGVRAGLNMARLALSPESPSQVDEENLLGLAVGLYGVVPISSQLAFQPEVLYSQQGMKFSGEGMTVKLKLDYVQVPLLLQIRPKRNSVVSLIAGPSLGFRTRTRFEVPGAPDEFTDEFEDEVNRFDVGLVAGAAADIGRWLVVDGRYTWGLMNIVKDPTDNESGKHRVLSLSAGVRF